jgi:hypothetical protein
MPLTLNTAPPEILVETFADLLSNRLVFTPDYGAALDELIYNLPDDDVYAIALSIKTWCQARPEIWKALEDELGKRGGKRSSTPIPPQAEHYKTLLTHKLHESFPKTTQAQLGTST